MSAAPPSRWKDAILRSLQPAGDTRDAAGGSRQGSCCQDEEEDERRGGYLTTATTTTTHRMGGVDARFGVMRAARALPREDGGGESVATLNRREGGGRRRRRGRQQAQRFRAFQDDGEVAVVSDVSERRKSSLARGKRGKEIMKCQKTMLLQLPRGAPRQAED